ncbi:hypothetical protein [Paenibacillus odorifer]|nr:hypothetical protein [Paenibacillus odorifer]
MEDQLIEAVALRNEGKAEEARVMLLELFQLIACQYLIINGRFLKWYT